MAHVVEWDGKNVPEELWKLPPGRYAVEPLDDAHTLTADEESGIREALASVAAGDGATLDEVRDRILGSLKR